MTTDQTTVFADAVRAMQEACPQVEDYWAQDMLRAALDVIAQDMRNNRALSDAAEAEVEKVGNAGFFAGGHAIKAAANHIEALSKHA